MLRSRSLLVPAVLSFALCLACDKPAEDAKGDKTDDKAAEDGKETPPPEPEPAEKKLEWTWKTSDVSKSMTAGTTLVYKQTGKDAKGGDVDDDYKCQVKSATAGDVGTVCNGVNHPSEDKGANEVATKEWSEYSPFFPAERPEMKLVERADLTVPAGTFDTVQAEITGFMGASYTVWMIADKPGVYAKVHKHKNVHDEEDQTDMVFELSGGV